MGRSLESIDKNKYPLLGGLIFTHILVFLICASWFISADWNSLEGISSLLASLFSSIGVLFLLVNIHSQNKEFDRLESEAKRNMEGAEKQRKISQFSSLAPIYYDLMKDNYPKIKQSGEDAWFDVSISFYISYCQSNDSYLKNKIRENAIKFRDMKYSDWKVGDGFDVKYAPALAFVTAYIEYKGYFADAFPDKVSNDGFMEFDNTPFGILGRRLHIFFEPETFMEET